MKNEDSAEGFRSYGETQTALESPRSFRGEQLAPYSEGIRLLWLDMYENKTGRFACPGLIWLMIEMQKAFEAIVAKSGAATNLETAWMLASAEIIRKVDDRATGQATILAWVSKLGRKDTDAATELAYALLDQARESDAKQAAESEGTDGPKSESPLSMAPT